MTKTKTTTTILSVLAALLLVPARGLPQAFERTANPARRSAVAAQVFERAVNPDAPSRARARRPSLPSPEVPSGPPRAKTLTAVTGRESAGGFSIEVVADGVLLGEGCGIVVLRRRADAAAGARPVVQYHRLSQELDHLVGEGAQHVVGVAGGEGDDQLDGPGRECVCRQGGGGGRTECADCRNRE